MSVYQLDKVKTISAHSWSPDRTRVAICPNTEDIHIYKNADSKDVSKWELEHVLKAHTMVVSGIDWCPLTNKIVTCSHDVNAFVWTYDGSKMSWTPTLSILRISRAALSCRWSPDGTMFAVASSSKVVPVLYYEEEGDWWVSKMIKKHKSTVIDIAWHPSSQLIATASSDFKCRIFSTYIEQRTQAGPIPIFGDISSYGFGKRITEFESSNGWVESVAWTPSGDGLAFAGHDSSISFVRFAEGQPPVCYSLKQRSLPYTVVTFLSNDVLVAAGHGFAPEIYQMDNASNKWQLLGCADAKETKTAGKSKAGAFESSRAMWRNIEHQGKEKSKGGDEIKTLHHNVITGINVYGDTHRLSSFDAFSTTGTDGRLVLWDKSALKKALPAIAI